MADVDPLGEVRVRNEVLLYRYRSMLRITGGSLIALFVSLVLNLVLVFHTPEPRYFAQNEAGGLAPIIPLHQPNQSQAAVMNFATEAVLSVNSVDFANIRRQLTDARRFFTPNGWSEYESELARTGTLDIIRKDQLVVSAAISSAPVVENEGEIYGLRFWDIQIPFVVRFQSESTNKTYEMLARVKVVRVPITQSAKGIAVAQFITQPRT